MMCLWASYKKKKIFASLKSMKKGVGSGVGAESGAGSISQRYRSGDPDQNLDSHQNVMDPQHCSLPWANIYKDQTQNVVFIGVL